MRLSYERRLDHARRYVTEVRNGRKQQQQQQRDSVSKRTFIHGCPHNNVHISTQGIDTSQLAFCRNNVNRPRQTGVSHIAPEFGFLFRMADSCLRKPLEHDDDQAAQPFIFNITAHSRGRHRSALLPSRSVRRRQRTSLGWGQQEHLSPSSLWGGTIVAQYGGGRGGVLKRREVL